jgi:hypothetical protein
MIKINLPFIYVEIFPNKIITKPNQIWKVKDNYKRDGYSHNNHDWIVLRSLPEDLQHPKKTWRYWSLNEFTNSRPSFFTYEITEEILILHYKYIGELK